MRLPGVPNPTDYRETPWSAQSQQTTVRLPGEPKFTNYRECPTPQTTMRLPGRVGMFEVKYFGELRRRPSLAPVTCRRGPPSINDAPDQRKGLRCSGSDLGLGFGAEDMPGCLKYVCVAVT